MKHAALQAETSRTGDAQKRTVVESFDSFVGFDKQENDETSIDREDEAKSLDLPLTFPKDWDGFVEDRKTSPQPPPYDYVGCLSIVSTPMLKDGSLRDENQMKELLSNLLSDPSVPCHRMLDAPSASSSTGSSSSSSAHHPPSGPNNHPAFPARRSTVSSTKPTLPPTQPSCPSEPPSQPDVLLWKAKQSLRATTYNRDMKGKTARTVVTRSLSASEAE